MPEGCRYVSAVGRAGKDEEGAALLSDVTLTTARVDARVELDSGTVLRMLPAPTPRWPDLLTVHSDADRMLFSSKVRNRYAASPDAVYVRVNTCSEWR